MYVFKLVKKSFRCDLEVVNFDKCIRYFCWNNFNNDGDVYDLVYKFEFVVWIKFEFKS